ncbi:uncharacterized protein LOC108093049 [Drosophila ficusphila]|uniref:uncharacterized protein LOC108093049 n=1 Tax=Drosophila ficusphila TaxID=30025 RepID=UPI0007E5ED3C|nr:uncharacterized protein LOC108093049 [Drosophila ficusphila]
MSSQFREKCGVSSKDELANMDPTESDFALELKPAPKQICIPEHQRQRVSCSQTSVYQRNTAFELPDKSWSVLYFGAGKDRTLK